MGRLIAYIIFIVVILSCNQGNKKIDEELPHPKNDTFNSFTTEDNIAILPKFSVDTLKYFDKNNDYTKIIICPEIKEQRLKFINSIITKEIKKKAALVSVWATRHANIHKGNKVSGVVEENILLKMYMDTQLISYGFVSLYSDENSMRPFRKYFTVNYDIGKNKFINFSDYFKIVNRSDSTDLKKIIYNYGNNTDAESYPLDNDLIFSVDNENIYFFFDMHGFMGNPSGLVQGVKRKYLDKFINDNYK